MKKLKHLFTLFLLFGLLCPLEILGQYAIPSINPQISSENPSIIPWKTKSSFSVGYKTTEGEYAEDKIASQKGFIQHGLLSIAGKYEGRNVRTGFEIISKKRKTQFIDKKSLGQSGEFKGERTNNWDYNYIDKSAGAAIGPLSIGYTEVSNQDLSVEDDMLYRADGIILGLDAELKLSYRGKFSKKVEKVGAGIMIGNVKNTHFNLSRFNRKTTWAEGILSSSSKMDLYYPNGDLNQSYEPITESQLNYKYEDLEEISAIGFRNGNEEEKQYHFEIYSIIRNGFEHSDNRSSTYIKGPKYTNGIIIEFEKINDYFILVEANQTIFDKACNTPLELYGCLKINSGIQTTTNRYKIAYGFIKSNFRLTLQLNNLKRIISKHTTDSLKYDYTFLNRNEFSINFGYEL